MTAVHQPVVVTTARAGEMHLAVAAGCTCGSYTQQFQVHRPAWPTAGAPVDPLAYAEEQGRRLHAYHLADLPRLQAGAR